MLLIGSHAFMRHAGETGREPLDIDVIATFSELGQLTARLRRETEVNSLPLAFNKTILRCRDGRIIEVEIAWPDTTAADMHSEECCYDSSKILPFENLKLASLDTLYTLKMSHRFLKNSPHFRKTRSDIMKMRAMGAKQLSWLKRREDETYTYRHPKLNVTKGDFFKGDGIDYIYEHDDIHAAVAHVNVPAYVMYAEDGEEVKSSKKKFFEVDEWIRLLGVLEEAQVLALERSQIPFRGQIEPRRSFDIALQKVCTSITSGWFRSFAWENFDIIEQMYEDNYVDRFWSAVESGTVRRLKEYTDDDKGRDRTISAREDGGDMPIDL